MDQINKVKSLSIWIFIVPFIAVNVCLILVTQFHELFPNQEDVIHNTFPYFDGGASISRTARPYPSWLIFKPAMFFTSFLLVKYWIYNKAIIELECICDEAGIDASHGIDHAKSRDGYDHIFQIIAFNQSA